MMKLSDIESKQLLPRFASDISWLMNAFDNIIKPICERVKSIDAPLTLESINACTDEELEALYNQYGVAQYYPNLSRETRDLMLFEMCKIYRYLGTPKAIEILCKYIFDNNPIVVKVLDNLAFNDEGELIDESLLDVFDINVESQSAFLDEYANARILVNIIRFSRNSQFLRYIYYDFPGEFSLSISPINGNVVASYYENNAICEPVELNHYTFIVADATTGQIVSGFSNELVYGEIEGIVLQSPKLVYGVDVTVPTIQFWFTDEGRNYDEDKELSSRSILRDENGNRIKSPDSTIYDNVPILAYMHINGDMLESTDGTIEYYGSGSLRTLTSVNGSAVGESVWSVFAERVFTLSFANTQLPDVTITMPADETGYKGTSITLPTMTGEYESGGKTWKPSAWDIGAFGDSYTLNADTVAHLIFEEVQDQEIDIDVNFGDPVTIPAGYSVQSVKSGSAYAFAENATGSSAGALWFTVPGKNYYFTERDKSLLGYKVDPCLQLYQYTSGTSGNWITSTSSQSPSMAIKPDPAYCVLNGKSSGVSVMLYFYATGPSSVSSIATAINGGKYALQMRRYDENEAFVPYHFNVPMTIWRYIDGVFSWQGDTTATKSLAYWYTKTASTNTFRIHCVKGILPSLYKIGWFAANKSDVYLNTGSDYALYDENGAQIPYDSNKSYTFLWCVRGQTTDVSIPANGFRTLYMTDQSGYLRFGSKTSGYTVGLASHIYYAET